MKTTTPNTEETDLIKHLDTDTIMSYAKLLHIRVTTHSGETPGMDLWSLDQALLELNARNVGVRERTASDGATALSFLTVHKHGKNWALMEGDDNLICLTVYKKGAQEVLRQLDEVIGT